MGRIVGKVYPEEKPVMQDKHDKPAKGGKKNKATDADELDVVGVEEDKEAAAE